MHAEIIMMDKKLYNDELPYFAHDGSAAIDLRSSETVELAPDSQCVVGSKIAIWTGSTLPVGAAADAGVSFAALVLPRSGAGVKGLVLGNLVGLIDSDYQGEIKLCLWNRTNEPMTVLRGDRVAQLMFILAMRPQFTLVEEFSDSTARGEGGFGSTGTR